MAQSDQELSGTLAKLAITDPTEAGSTSVGPSHEEASNALETVVDNTAQKPGGGEAHILHKVDEAAKSKHPWLRHLAPVMEKLAAHQHAGNFVMTRDDPPQKTWETMPIYARLGMHLLFVTGNHIDLADQKRLENLMRNQSIKEGKIFDSEENSAHNISNFIKTYELEDQLQELAQPDPASYKTFNEFFYRKLKPDARPVTSPDDPKVITSAADCRLTVFEDISIAKKIWVKGKQFTLPHLFDDESIAALPAFSEGAAIAIFRLAPADYHRFHSPVSATVGAVKHVNGQYFTVNPQAVNEDFNVFTENRRDVCLLSLPNPSGSEPIPVAFVAIGAMLVGSIAWTKNQGDEVSKGEELGYFAYGGSTVIAVFPKGSVTFDADLLENSEKALETVVKVGNRIGTFV